MTILGVLGSKGGSGASLLATNLAISLTFEGKTLLIDLHTRLAYDDLLLDLKPEHTWEDLLTVSDELTDRHLELTLVKHASGLQMLAAPEGLQIDSHEESIQALLNNLKDRFDWLVIDLPLGQQPTANGILEIIDVLLMLTTGDLPSLRNTRRTLNSLPTELRANTYLVMNQMGRGHPVDPKRVAQTLNLQLLASLPPDPRAVGYQVSFGTPCVSDARSSLGRSINKLTQRLLRALGTGEKVILEVEEALDGENGKVNANDGR